MSIVGPRPERPYFVEQFKHRIPQYMLRHKVQGRHHRLGAGQRLARQHVARKADRVRLYYIENWSVALDLKIMWLTLSEGFFHKHALS